MVLWRCGVLSHLSTLDVVVTTVFVRSLPFSVKANITKTSTVVIKIQEMDAHRKNLSEFFHFCFIDSEICLVRETCYVLHYSFSFAKSAL